MSLILSTILSSLIAMAVMLPVLYFPRLIGRKSFDVLRALGSGVTGRLDARSMLVGVLLFTAGGLIFGFLYGLLAQTMLTGDEPFGPFPAYGADGLRFLSDPAWSFAFLGHWIGAGHGVVVSLLTAVVVVEHHPIERFRGRMGVVPLIMVSHIIYGGVVMFFHYHFLTSLGA